MTRVTFYSNLVDKQKTLLILLQRQMVANSQVTVMFEDQAAAEQGSEAIWQVEPSAFLPNVLATDQLADHTPIVLDWQEEQLCQDDVLINMTQKQLTSFSRFKQMIELVGEDEQDKAAARERYMFYKNRGYEIKHHNQSEIL